MTISNYTDLDSVRNSLPDLNFDPDVRVIAIDGEPCEIWYESGRYYVKQLGTEEIYRFTTLDSFRNFTDNHTWETQPEPTQPAMLALPAPKIAGLLPAVAASVAPAAEHLIEMIICKRCQEVIDSPNALEDAELCAECAKASEPVFRASYAQTATIRLQQQMIAETGINTGNPHDAWQAKMNEWLAAHPNPTTKPAPQPRPFMKVERPAQADKAA